MQRLLVLLLAAVVAIPLSARPVIYCTDLFHPHEDPDDHFDLATLSALPELEVKAILLDQGARQRISPGAVPVQQLLFLTGRNVPSAVGLGTKLAAPGDTGQNQPAEFQGAVHLLLKTLRESPEPVTIVTAGSVRDLCAAWNREPQLLKDKVDRVYLNIGNAKVGGSEYNADLDPQAYVGLVRSGLPLYVCLCLPMERQSPTSTYSAWWRFRQQDVLDPAPPELRRFFIYALQRCAPNELDPLAALTSDLRPWRRLVWGMERNMWCTASLLHAAGRRIFKTATGFTAAPTPPAGAQVEEVFKFFPARLELEDDGRTRMLSVVPDSRAGAPHPNVHLLVVASPAGYPDALRDCLRELMSAFPATLLAHTDVFESGKDGYHTYRIPAIEMTPDGTLIAFAEARKHNADDPGFGQQDIDLVFKRSADLGRTWSGMAVLEDPGEFWSAANPSTVVDREHGRVWLFYLRSRPGRSTETSRPGTDDMQTIARWSEDNGRTWSEPLDLTAVARDMNDPNWRASVPGPGGAIQTRSGRLLVPVWKHPFANFAIYSDDHGQTWRRSQLVPAKKGGNENQLVELADGRILMDIRQDSGAHRWLTESADGGETWGPPYPGEAVDPVACSVERVSVTSKSKPQDRLVSTGPAGPGRRCLVLRTSDDDGETFGRDRVISDGYAAYSELTVLKDGSVGILWERGEDRGYQFITFTRVAGRFLEH